MHNAPSVVYPVGRSVFYALALAVLGGLSGAALAWGWWNSWNVSPDNVLVVRWTAGFAAWLVWGLWAWWCWARQPKGVLKWDAKATPRDIEMAPGAWFWMPEKSVFEPMVVHPEGVFDWQGRILLRLHGPSRMGLWIWLEQTADPLHWDDLRRALVSKR